VEKDKVKEISILLGAGFSKSLAGLPLASDLSSDVLKAFKNDSRLQERFENTEGGNFNYEKFAQYLGNMKDQGRFATELGLDSLNLDDGEIKKLVLCERILYKTLLDKLLSVDYAEKFKQRQKSFVDLITKLLEDGYKLHFFDLNHDLLLDRIFSDEQDLRVENFFEFYEDGILPNQGYISLEDTAMDSNSVSKSHGSKEKGIILLRSKLRSKKFAYDDKKLFHYKPHGALNLIYLQRVGTEGNRPFTISYIHLLRNFKQDGSPDHGKAYQDNLKVLFNTNNSVRPISQMEWIRYQPAILNQGSNKASILTKDFLYYFPEVYSRFISLGEKGVPLLTIGYGFQDSHFNTAIMYHYKTDPYPLKPKILFSGYEEIPLITDKLKTISLDDSSGLTRNEFGRKVFCSDCNFEDFLAV
jgi:hypothetical protein